MPKTRTSSSFLCRENISYVIDIASSMQTVLLLVCVIVGSCRGFLIDSSISGSAKGYWESNLDSPATNLVNHLKDSHDCTSIYEVLHNFTNVIHQDRVAYKAAHVLRDQFPKNYPTVPHLCTCSGSPSFWKNEQQSNHGDCFNRDIAYKRLYTHFFGSGRNTKLGCNTHRSLWHGLVAISNHHLSRPRQCQWTLIQEISAAYGKYGSGCQCQTTQLATQTTTTTTTSTTTTTTPVPSTTTEIPVHSCDKFQVIDAVGKESVISSAVASACAFTTESPSDALVIETCSGIGSIQTWRKGNNVMDKCQDGSIKPYTAIASFMPGMTTYESVGHIGAVFIKCEPNGIQIAFQDCGQSPILKHLQLGGFGQLDPNSYFTIAV